jgi:ketosteroid isomerase-like protein
MNASHERNADHAAVRDLVESWVRTVCNRDHEGILANHSTDMLMFDVPPSVESKGLEAYRKTWDSFFAWSDDPVIFEIKDMHITASTDVAFVAALMRCAGVENGERMEVEFRLTIGLRKVGAQWIVLHEHHSIPAG